LVFPFLDLDKDLGTLEPTSSEPDRYQDPQQVEASGVRSGLKQNSAESFMWCRASR